MNDKEMFQALKDLTACVTMLSNEILALREQLATVTPPKINDRGAVLVKIDQ